MYADKKYVYVYMCVAPVACWCCRCLPGSQSKPTKHRLGRDTPIPRQHSVLFLSLLWPFWQAAQLFLESCSQAQRGSTSACWCCRCLPGSQAKQKNTGQGAILPSLANIPCCFCHCFGRRRNFSWKAAARPSGGRPLRVGVAVACQDRKLNKKHRPGCDTPIPRQHSVPFLSMFWQAAQLFLESCC